MFGRRLPKASNAALQRYEASYLKLCRKRWADVSYARHQVEAIAVFLDARGKFQEYMEWAAAEALRESREVDASDRASPRPGPSATPTRPRPA
jgi:hypothetical protein